MEPLTSPSSGALGKEPKKVEQEKKETSDLTSSDDRVASTAPDIIAKSKEGQQSAMSEREVKLISGSVTAQEAIDSLTQFLASLTLELESKQKQTPSNSYQVALKGIQDILIRTKSDLSGSLVPVEKIERRLLISRDELVDLLVANLYQEELDDIKIPTFQGPRWLNNVSDENKKKFEGPKALFNLFNNMANRILLKRKFERIAVEKTPLAIERYVERALQEDLPDLALSAAELLYYSAKTENILEVLHHYIGPQGDVADFRNAIALANAHPETGAFESIAKSIQINKGSEEQIKILLEIVQKLPPTKEKYSALNKIIEILIDQKEYQQAKLLLPQLIDIIKVAFKERPELEHHLAMQGPAIIQLGLVKEINLDISTWMPENKKLFFTEVIKFAKKNPTENIWNFEILKDQTLLQALKKEPEIRFSLLYEGVFQPDQIVDEQERKEIAMNALEVYSKLENSSDWFFVGGTEKFLKNLSSYNFKDTSCYVEIIKKAAEVRTKMVSNCLVDLYKLIPIDKNGKLEIAKDIFMNSPYSEFMTRPLEDPHLIYDVPLNDFLDLVELNMKRFFSSLDDEILGIFGYFFNQRPLIPDLFQDLLKQAHAEKNPALRENLINWVNQQKITYQTFVFAYSIRKIDVKKELEALKVAYEQLFKYRSPQDREYIVSSFRECKREKFLIKWYKLITTATKKGTETPSVVPPSVHTMVPAVLALLCSDDQTILQDFVNNLRKERDVFRDAKNMHQLGSFLIGLDKSNFSPDERTALIAQIFVEKGKALGPRLRYLNLFLNMRKGEMLTDAENSQISNEGLNKLIQGFIREAFQLNEKDFGGPEKLNELFFERIENKFRDKDAIFVFSGKINELPSPSKDVMKAAYTKFIGSLLKNEYHQMRRQSPQMLELQKTEQGQRIAKTWDDFPQLQSFDLYLSKHQLGTTDTFSEQVKSFLTERLINDHHLRDEKNNDQFQTLLPYLYDLLTKEKEISAESLLKQLSLEKTSPLIQLQQCCLELYLSKNKDDALLTRLESIVNTLKDKDKDTEKGIWDEFLRDVVGFKDKFKTDQKKGALSIGLTNDPCDLLVLARETTGCQSIDGSPATNKSALAYVIDGKNAAIVIKGDDGRIIARAVLRLLLDTTTKKPVLFIERHYMKIDDPRYSIALNNYAISYAKELSLPLLTTEALPMTDGHKEHGPIFSVGSNAPYEYSDASGGQNTGEFVIPKSYVMFEP